MTPSIYLIRNKGDGKAYIGQSINVAMRMCSHRHKLRRKIHPNAYLQNAWNKYGEDAFDFVVVEECTQDELTEAEQRWIDNAGCDGRYNITSIVSPATRMTAEARAKLSASRKRKYAADPEYRARQAAQGREVLSRPEVLAARLAAVRANIGRPRTPGEAASTAAAIEIARGLPARQSRSVASGGRSILGENEDGHIVRFEWCRLARDYGFDPSTIHDCLTGKRRSHAGYRWRYADEPASLPVQPPGEM